MRITVNMELQGKEMKLKLKGELIWELKHCLDDCLVNLEGIGAKVKELTREKMEMVLELN